MTRPIRALLIANRGEIACRVAATARRLGIRAVAVYSEADIGARHVAVADEAYPIGPSAPRESYLNVAAILAAAAAARVDAIHPGYGFLSENAQFAEACAAAGFAFVGPPPAAIRAMGLKRESKELVAAAGVPVVPGYAGADWSPARVEAEAAAIGYPVLVKASAGGGGRGMRVVERPDALADAVAAAAREAEAAFGDPTLLIEKYVVAPRHVEVQVFADAHGNVVHLHDRDCSVQRRHQKVVEEAPAPDLPDAMRHAMHDAAIAAARAVGYRNAGTVEFVVGGGAFYFLEMNTRLQVEHPVTEAITGLDLVEWQIRVAEGGSLPLSQDRIVPRGHAVEVRLCAEDPRRGYLPQAGRIRHLRLPDDRPDIRVDSGVRGGDAVPVFYDSMIAKIVAHGATRAQALGRLAAALVDTEVVGLATNLDLLTAVVEHPDFLAGPVDTGFLGREADRLMRPAPPADRRAVAVACLALMLDAREQAAADAMAAGDPWSPWASAGGWQLNLPGECPMFFDVAGAPLVTRVAFVGDGLVVTVGDARVAVSGRREADGMIAAVIDGVVTRARVIRHGADLAVIQNGRNQRLSLVDPLVQAGVGVSASGRAVAPMPGRVLLVHARVGQEVAAGDPLVVIEAMKMEHRVVAACAGRVARVSCAVGDTVEDGFELVTLEDVAS
jgi:3-methylcrotonyl-CoA carboxylase alpha subunit